jgi:tetratricopeptide (TPR) repeat protein
LDEALAACRKQVKIKPDHRDAWNTLGLVFHAQGKFGEAMTAFRKQIEINPVHETIWYNMGITLHRQDKPDEALAAFQRQIKINQAQIKPQSVVTVYRKLLELQPDHKSAWNEFGNMLWEQRQRREALAAYQQQVDVNPYHESAWYNTGRALWDQGKTEEALTAFQQQVEVNPVHEDAWNNLGRILLEQGKADEAIAAFKKQAEVNPDYQVSWAWIGEKLRDQGKLEKAAAAYAEALAKESDNLNLLHADILLALLQGDKSRCQTRIAVAKPFVKPDNRFFALLPFYAWLSEPAQSWEPVMTAIEGLKPGVSISLTFEYGHLIPVLKQQSPEAQQIAQHFIAFFNKRTDLPTLKARLAENKQRESS